MSPRTGRPTQNPKSEIIKIRATVSDREKLLYCCEKTGMTQYEVVMKGINEVYNKIKSNWHPKQVTVTLKTPIRKRLINIFYQFLSEKSSE